MKALFIMLVLMAVAYLLVPKSAVDSEQAASALLANVDEKLDKFRQGLIAKQEQRIDELTKKISELENKIDANELFVSKRNRDKEKSVSDDNVTTSSFNHNSTLVHAPALKPDGFSVEQSFDHSNEYINGESNEVVQIQKKQRINRQASLQTIADRMNRTSLLAITKQ